MIKDLHHVAMLTADMDRLIAFYERVFEARVTLDMTEEGLRHAFIEIGPHTMLHPFQIPDVPLGPAEPIFGRGRLDHLALNAADEDAFWEVRRRIVAEGAGDGTVTDMGTVLNVVFTDPDGSQHEVVWAKTGVPVDAGRTRAEWTTVEPPDPLGA
ncbi:MAG: hypothetical protein AVDCRST_MAG79-1465 [uncultured Thermoleophilia bacterium]|uniref:VOC domain-containing protein n=1 Tax=uncultured Thermoleophilia bacterium TaxID=1497501 RepID=A0A6J4U2C9_9ACTN|nr:MAG: hypothetical protein AVDCRST_MAG79-1465 [uncultured Thermoleophilia bacterium]